MYLYFIILDVKSIFLKYENKFECNAKKKLCDWLINRLTQPVLHRKNILYFYSY